MQKDCESGASEDTGGERGGGQRVNDRGDRTERGRTLGAWQKHDLCTAQSTWACASGREWAERGGSGCPCKGDGGAGPETWSRPSEHCSSEKRSQDGGKGKAGNARHDDVSDVMSSRHHMTHGHVITRHVIASPHDHGCDCVRLLPQREKLERLSSRAPGPAGKQSLSEKPVAGSHARLCIE